MTIWDFFNQHEVLFVCAMILTFVVALFVCLVVDVALTNWAHIRLVRAQKEGKS